MTGTVLRLQGIVAVALIMCGGPPQSLADDGFRRLSGAEIKRLVTGKTVTDDVHYTDYFKADGSYEGVFMNKRLTGAWKVKGAELCITRGPEPSQCDEFWRSGSKLQRRKPGLPIVRDEVFVRAK